MSEWPEDYIIKRYPDDYWNKRFGPEREQARKDLRIPEEDDLFIDMDMYTTDELHALKRLMLEMGQIGSHHMYTLEEELDKRDEDGR